MSNTMTLEKSLENAAETDKDAKAFWTRYLTVKDYLSTQYYPWIQAACPWYTDHGQLHIESVMQTASIILGRQLTGRKGPLTPLDKYLILSAILWHDVGNVLGRTGHADRAAELAGEIKKLAFPSIETFRLVGQISAAHAGEDGLLKAPPEVDLSTPNTTSYTVRPRSLAAIVRFADEVSENQARISRELLPKVPEGNKIYWHYADAISAARPEPERQRVVITIALDPKVASQMFPCGDKYAQALNGNKTEMSLIEYLVCRLDKMNNERAYCTPEFRQYADIREIEVRFSLYSGHSHLRGHDLTVVMQDRAIGGTGYPAIPTFKDFFGKYPNWHPDTPTALWKEFQK